jgi:hypothetical protein
MSDTPLEATKERIGIELTRLEQEVRVIQHKLDDLGPDGDRADMVLCLRHLASRANRLADAVEKGIVG